MLQLQLQSNPHPYLRHFLHVFLVWLAIFFLLAKNLLYLLWCWPIGVHSYCSFLMIFPSDGPLTRKPFNQFTPKTTIPKQQLLPHTRNSNHQTASHLVCLVSFFRQRKGDKYLFAPQRKSFHHFVYFNEYFFCFLYICQETVTLLNTSCWFDFLSSNCPDSWPKNTMF